MRRSVFNQKGGVGKTSVACNIAAAFAKAGRKVLVVDLDAQANSTRYLLGDAAPSVTKTVADFFASTLNFNLFRESLKDTIYPTNYDQLYIIPAEESLTELQPKLEGRYKIFKLAEAVAHTVELMGFDEVIFDTPPALNFYSMSSLIASDRVLVPFDCDQFSADALTQVVQRVEEVRQDHQENLVVEGVVINQFQAQARLPMETITKLQAAGYHVLKPFLSSSVVMRESHSAGIPLPYFRPKHKLTLEFEALATMLLGPPKGRGKSRGATAGSRRVTQPPTPERGAEL